MQHNYWIYLFIMFAVTYLVRVLPLVVFKKKITNRFVRSFLTYIPYAVLAAMTFPAVFFAVDCIPAAAAGLVAGVIVALAVGSLFTVAVVAGVIVALAGGSLFTVAISASAVVYVLLLIL